MLKSKSVVSIVLVLLFSIAFLVPRASAAQFALNILCPGSPPHTPYLNYAAGTTPGGLVGGTGVPLGLPALVATAGIAPLPPLGAFKGPKAWTNEGGPSLPGWTEEVLIPIQVSDAFGAGPWTLATVSWSGYVSLGIECVAPKTWPPIIYTVGGNRYYRFYLLDPAAEINFTYVGPVGGIWVPVDKLGLLAPYIGLASTIIVATAATAIYVKRIKRRKEKQ